ncbi:TniB family NTP-binding protein [Mesorhizobium sp. YC-39]|nr:TniB family NTP-binding protein [Mesorhizobium sp. YC-39]
MTWSSSRLPILMVSLAHGRMPGSYREHRVVLNTMRFLSNRLQISLVCFGVCAVRCNRRRHIGFEKLSTAAGELRIRGIESHD